MLRDVLFRRNWLSTERLSGMMSTPMEDNHTENHTVELRVDHHYVVVFHSCHNMATMKVINGRITPSSLSELRTQGK